MRKRIVRALLLVVVAVGASIGVGSAAGAVEWGGSHVANLDFGSTWD